MKVNAKIKWCGQRETAYVSEEYLYILHLYIYVCMAWNEILNPVESPNVNTEIKNSF